MMMRITIKCVDDTIDKVEEVRVPEDRIGPRGITKKEVRSQQIKNTVSKRLL